jgi:hypothetical protein
VNTLGLDNAADHRLARKWWAIATVFAFGAGILLRIGAPSVAMYVLTPHTWLLGVVGFAYHHGWLRRDTHAPAAALDSTTKETP